MVFDWHIPDDRKGELLWVGNPFLYENGIFQVKAYVQTEDGCYYSYHAWSQLPYLKIGGLCSNGKSPMPVFAETKGMTISLRQAGLLSQISDVTDLLRRDQPQLTARLAQEKQINECVYLEYAGKIYIIPFPVILCAFLGNLSPLINGALHEGKFEDWIRNETVYPEDNSIKIDFSEELSVHFLSQRGVVNHLAWIRYLPELFNWWKSIAASSYSGQYRVSIPHLEHGKIELYGKQYPHYFFVQSIKVLEVHSLFRKIIWTHPRLRESEPQKSRTDSTAAHILDQCAETVENDINAFSQKGIPHMDDVGHETILFMSQPEIVKSRRKIEVEQNRSRKTEQDVEHEVVTTNEYAVSGKRRPMNTIPSSETEETNEIRSEFADLKRAIELIPGLKITDVEYMECGSCLWMLVKVLLWGREIVVAEGRKERLPCASTLLLSGKLEGELSELLSSNGENWDKGKITNYCRNHKKNNELLRHSVGRSAMQWGHLLREKMRRICRNLSPQ